jgi:hypothetical protein
MPGPPDTNIFCFLVKQKGSTSLSRMNELNQWIYEHFTIESEHSAGEYSYSQPFFLSHTILQHPCYSQRSVADALQRLEIDPSDYPERGLFVLRATLMNPYIVLAEETGRRGRPYLAEFTEKLAARAEEGVEAINRKRVGEPIF